MVRDLMADLDRARASGKRLGRPRTTPFTVQRIRAALEAGCGVCETVRPPEVPSRSWQHLDTAYPGHPQNQ
jgi:hypothetical protein